jgi:hypothetical protein
VRARPSSPASKTGRFLAFVDRSRCRISLKRPFRCGDEGGRAFEGVVEPDLLLRTEFGRQPPLDSSPTLTQSKHAKLVSW